MKNKFKRFMKSKWSKILCCVMICCVLISLFTISASAEEPNDFSFNYTTLSFSYDLPDNVYSTYPRLYVSRFAGDIVENGSVVSTLRLYLPGKLDVPIYSLNLNDYPDYVDPENLTFTISSLSYFPEMYVNGKLYQGSLTRDVFYNLSSPDDSYHFSANYTDNTSIKYYYNFVIPAISSSDYNDYFVSGFLAGVNSQQAYDKYYFSGYDYGYSVGLEHGLTSSGSGSFGQNLLGDTLSAPMKALNNFTLFVAPNGSSVTLGGIIGAVIGLSLLLVFLSFFR